MSVGKIQGEVKYLRKSFTLKDLDCASCANKIEFNLGKLEGIHAAQVDFVNKKLNLDFQPNIDISEIMEKVKDIVTRIEAQVKVIEYKEAEEEKTDYREIAFLLGGGLLFALAFLPIFNPILKFILFLSSYLVIGGEIVLRAGKNILKGQIFDENFLMTIATFGAFAIGEYPEGVGVMLFYRVGEFFQDVAVNRSRKSIKALVNIKPEFANLKDGGNLKRIAPEEVRIGQHIVVKPGEKVPLDGKIIEGESSLDTSALTGESLPREVKVHDQVLAGCINLKGLLTVQVQKSYSDSAVAKILDLVQNATSKKAPTEKFITKFARYYTPVVVAAAVLIALLPPLILEASFNEWLYKALVFLVVSCPCALVISIPLGFFGGIGAASKKGILIKGGNYLEALSKVGTVVFDKTGTLTKGQFEVQELKVTNDFKEEELLEYAAYAECYSNHPIALSILKRYEQEIDQDQIKDYEELSGKGIRAKIKGKIVLAGNAKLMEAGGVAFKQEENIGTIIHVAIDQIYAGYLVIADELKKDAARAIQDLKAHKVKTVMLTGDNNLIGAKVAGELGIDEYYGELLPGDKVTKLEKLLEEKAPNSNLAFMGDGINDAPVLARADIGFAMGALGSDAAIEAADVVIMTDEPHKIVEAMKIAKKTQKVVWQNILLALGVKAIVIVLGLAGIAVLWEAVFADVGVALLAVLNSMRILKI